jgi:hypothetical protein
MNFVAVLILCTLALLMLSLGGLATWVWLAMASAEDDMRRFADSGVLRPER